MIALVVGLCPSTHRQSGSSKDAKRCRAKDLVIHHSLSVLKISGRSFQNQINIQRFVQLRRFLSSFFSFPLIILLTTLNHTTFCCCCCCCHRYQKHFIHKLHHSQHEKFDPTDHKQTAPLARRHSSVTGLWRSTDDPPAVVCFTTTVTFNDRADRFLQPIRGGNSIVHQHSNSSKTQENNSRSHPARSGQSRSRYHSGRRRCGPTSRTASHAASLLGLCPNESRVFAATAATRCFRQHDQ